MATTKSQVASKARKEFTLSDSDLDEIDDPYHKSSQEEDVSIANDDSTQREEVEDDDDDLLNISYSMIMFQKKQQQQKKPAVEATSKPELDHQVLPSPKQAVGEYEHNIKHDVEFLPSDFIIFKNKTSRLPMVRILNLSMLILATQEEIIADKKKYFNGDELVPNLFLEIKPPGVTMRYIKASVTQQLNFTPGEYTKEVQSAMKRTAKVAESFRIAEEMYDRAVKRVEANARKDLEETKRLKQTIVIEDDTNKPVIAAAAAAAVERIVHPVEFRAGMELIVQRRGMGQTLHKILEITLVNEVATVRLDDEWCLVKQDLVMAGKNDRLYSFEDLIKAESTFHLGHSGEESQAIKKMRVDTQAKQSLLEAAKSEFPEFI